MDQFTDSLTKFEPTPLEDIDEIIKRQHEAFNSGVTRPIEFRLQQLRKLYWAIEKYKNEILQACKLDLGKSPFEAEMSESAWVQNEIILIEQNLAKWAKDEYPEDVPLTHKLLRPRIRKDPLGVALVIGAFNFPFQLSLCPMVGAIAAGCCCVVKPSENAPYSSAVMAKIVNEALDPECYAVVQGNKDVSEKLLSSPIRWDKIFFTGGEAVGKIVAAAAAKTLTPVTLELGGQNPAIVTANANARQAAKRLLWAKCFNAGQVCLSQNWVLVEQGALDEFIAGMKVSYAEFFPKGPLAADYYGRIASKAATEKIVDLLERSKGKVILGGETDVESRYVAPTVVLIDSADDALVCEETFGPIIPILPVANLEEAIKLAGRVHSTPLAIYPFGNDKEVERILSSLKSGGVTINDGFFHATVPTLPFGGVGRSGNGSYRGKQSLITFSHLRSIAQTPTSPLLDWALKIRYMPYTQSKRDQYGVTLSKPTFDKQGKPYLLRPGSWAWYLALGASSLKGMVVRYLFLALAIVLARRRQASR